jgi:hypothetical protein
VVEVAEKVFMINQIRAQSRRDQLLILIFALLIAYVISSMILILPGIPAFYQRVTEGTVPTVQLGSEELVSNTLIAEQASQRGLTIDQYANYTILRALVSLTIFGGAALLILWKAGGNWFAWYTVFMLLFYPTGGALDKINQVSQAAGNYANAGAILWPLFLLYLYLFPNGWAVPRWTRWPMGVIILLHFLLQTTAFLSLGFKLGNEYLPIWQGGFFVVILVGFPLILVSQVLRYRNDSTLVERQQTKWFVGSLALLAMVSVIQTILSGSFNNVIGWAGDLSETLDFLIPVSLVISILRYRLWDIDVIIRKTLVYGALTATLALVFFGGVALLQQIFGRISRTDDSPVAIVISTLAIAALFSPLRRRIQDFIDRRFYRRKYDADLALEEFAQAARNETDLDALTGKLVEVVSQTMQPEQVNIWFTRIGERR